MHKLMVLAAAMMVAGGVFAQCGDLPETPVSTCASVDDFKASVKTTVAGSTDVEQECSDPATVCYRKTKSISMKGFVFSCDCCTLQPDVMVWFGKGWSSDKESDTAYVVSGYWRVLNIIGKKNQDAEGFLSFSDYPGSNGNTAAAAISESPIYLLPMFDTFYFNAAGFGSAKDMQLSKLSGHIVGMVEPPTCSVSCEDPQPSVAYPFCGYFKGFDYSDLNDVATGTWSLKHNKKLSEQALSVNERYLLAGKLPKSIRYIIDHGVELTVAQWVAGDPI